MTEGILKEIPTRIASWQLVPSRGGVFDVWADEQLLFSKKQVGRFPTTEEILAGLGH